MRTELEQREIEEAAAAGEQALRSLEAARDQLDSARNWGIFDMLGGGLISSMVKQSKVKDASLYLTAARESLAVFERELRDVQGLPDLNIEMNGFLSFADVFFDNMFVDFMVQSQISDARKRIQEAMEQVEAIIRELKRSR